jgi:hypothetical protein
MHISSLGSSGAAPQLNNLIEQLNRFVRLIELDIEEEERRLNNFDVSNPNCPASVQAMHLRRDNLLATISTLKGKLANFAS